MLRFRTALLALALLGTACTTSSSSSDVRYAITYITSSPQQVSDHAIVGVPFLLTPFVQTDALEAPGTHGTTTVVSASCDGDACTAEIAADHPGAFRITPTKAQDTRINVRANNSRAGAVAGSYTMSFVEAPAAVVDLSSPDVDVDHLLYASLPGATFDLTGWPGVGGFEAAIEGAATWTSDSDAFALTAAMTGGHTETLTASHAGTSHVTIAAGPVTRTVAFSVADVAQAKSIALHALVPTSVISDIRSSQGLVADAAAAVDVSSGDASYGVVLTMNDGTKAVGGADKLTASPAGLVKLESRHHGEIVAISRLAAGKGTITATIGSAMLSIPFAVK